MKAIKDLLVIDCAQATAKVCDYIKQAVEKERVRGVVMGLSGGIDSALLATLAVKALGKERVSVYFLKTKNSEKDSLVKAQAMAKWLGLDLNIADIDAAMCEREKKASFFKWLSAIPPFMVPAIAAVYYMIVGETPYITTLRKHELRKNKFKRWVYDHIMNGVESMFDGPCEERRVVLEKIAKEHNLLLIGSGNYTETLTGWFTVKGVDNMPYSPVGDLFKMQVMQLSEYLDIPVEIRKRKPTADVLKGATDALALGINYDKIDAILCGIQKGISDEDLRQYGIIQSEIDRVRNICKLSEWKRRA